MFYGVFHLSHLLVEIALMNDLTVLIPARPVPVRIGGMGFTNIIVIIFAQFFQIFTCRVSRDALVLCRARFRRVIATLFVTVETAVDASDARSRTPDETVAKLAGGRRCVVVLFKTMRCRERHVGSRHSDA